MPSLLFSAQRLWTLTGLLGLGKIVADSHFLISFLCTSILPLLAFSLLLLFPQFHHLPFFSLLYSEPGISPRAGHEIHYRFSSNHGFAFGREFCGVLVMCWALTWVPLTVRVSSGTYVKYPRGPQPHFCESVRRPLSLQIWAKHLFSSFFLQSREKVSGSTGTVLRKAQGSELL